MDSIHRFHRFSSHFIGKCVHIGGFYKKNMIFKSLLTT